MFKKFKTTTRVQMLENARDWIVKNTNKAKFTMKNIIYILLWTIVSLVSSYNQIIPSIQELWEGDLSSILCGIFYTDIIAPLLIWIIAFFVDYLYQLWTIGNNEKLNTVWVKASNLAILIVFIVLVIGFFHHENIYQKTNSVICLLLCMILLKTSALYVVTPSYEVEKR